MSYVKNYYFEKFLIKFLRIKSPNQNWKFNDRNWEMIHGSNGGSLMFSIYFRLRASCVS